MLRLPRRLALALLLCSRVMPAWAEEQLVLVVGANSPIVSLGSLDLHKAFLGLPVTIGEHRIRALRNDADELMHRVFFQSIVSMSEPAYDRRMLAQALQQDVVPPTLSSTRAVFDQLAQDPNAVSFAWAVDAEKDLRIRVIRTLWRR